VSAPLVADGGIGQLTVAEGSGPAPRPGVPVEMVELTRSFGPVLALDRFSLRIGPGELVALLGPSGCGKTTALRALGGLEHLDGGRILVDGVDITGVPAHRRSMGMVFQAYSLFPNLTAAENVAFGLRLRKLGRRECRRRAGELLELVGLSAQADRFPYQLSGGQQQRVALIRALAIEPPVLLLDEPLSALDAKVRTQLRDEIRRIQREVGITTFFVTHDQEEALSIADRVGVMESGRLLQCDTPATVYSAPASVFVAEFVGTVNRLRGLIGQAGVVEVAGSRLPRPPATEPLPPGTEVDVLVRPEAVRVRALESGEAVVTSRSFLGPIVRVEAVLQDGARVVAAMFGADVEDLAPGVRVALELSGPPLLLTRSKDQR